MASGSLQNHLDVTKESLALDSAAKAIVYRTKLHSECTLVSALSACLLEGFVHFGFVLFGECKCVDQ